MLDNIWMWIWDGIICWYKNIELFFFKLHCAKALPIMTHCHWTLKHVIGIWTKMQSFFRFTPLCDATPSPTLVFIYTELSELRELFWSWHRWNNLSVEIYWFIFKLHCAKALQTTTLCHWTLKHFIEIWIKIHIFFRFTPLTLGAVTPSPSLVFI